MAWLSGRTRESSKVVLSSGVKHRLLVGGVLGLKLLGGGARRRFGDLLHAEAVEWRAVR
jgi:hypothetical protein